ncbi:MAG: RsmE family RNA methyltransferase [Planctomycetota bacterium]
MNLILIEAHELVPSLAAPGAPRYVVTFTDTLRVKHLAQVLRVEVGARLRVGVIDGALGEGEVAHIGVAAFTLLVTLADAPAPARIDVLLAVPRPKALGRLYSPLAQLGIGRLVLSGAERVERYYFDAHQVDVGFARAQFLEGLAQARDTRVPQVEIHRRLDHALASALGAASGPPSSPGAAHRAGAALAAPSRAFYADPGDAPAPRVAVQGLGPTERVLVVIGPEGGFRDRERAFLARAGLTPIALGPRVLRTDVAAIALLALLHDAL